MSTGAMLRTRDAASSIASGMPSSARTSATSVGALRTLRWKSARTARALDEKLDCGIAGCGVQAGIGCWQLDCRNPELVLAIQPQRTARGHEQVQRRQPDRKLLDQVLGKTRELFEVVQHEQHMPAAQRLGQGPQRAGCTGRDLDRSGQDPTTS